MMNCLDLNAMQYEIGYTRRLNYVNTTITLHPSFQTLWNKGRTKIFVVRLEISSGNRQECFFFSPSFSFFLFAIIRRFVPRASAQRMDKALQWLERQQAAGPSP